MMNLGDGWGVPNLVLRSRKAPEKARLSPSEFEILSEFMQFRSSGHGREAARLVLVEGLSPTNAAIRVGVSSSNARLPTCRCEKWIRLSSRFWAMAGADPLSLKQHPEDGIFLDASSAAGNDKPKRARASRRMFRLSEKQFKLMEELIRLETPDNRRIAYLFYVRGLRQNEIVAEMDISPFYVSRIVRRCEKWLKMNARFWLSRGTRGLFPENMTWEEAETSGVLGLLKSVAETQKKS